MATTSQGMDSRGLGWLPDVPSIRDYTEEHPEVAPLLEQTRLQPRIGGRSAPSTSGGSARGRGGVTAVATAAAAAPALLPAVDLRAHCPPIEDQGSLGSCTANAAVALIEYFERRASGKHIDASRLFVYKVTRDILGWTGDTGTYLRTTMGALVLFGAPPERYWPYDGTPSAINVHYDVEPTSFCFAFGADFKAIKYYRLDGPGVTGPSLLAAIRQYVAAGLPSMFGFPVYPEYDSPLPGGLIPFPSPTSPLRGGHANVVVGYDDNKMIGADKGALLVRNSWGTGWGDAGYGWMSYRYVTEALATDFWSVIKASWVQTGNF